MIEGAGHESRHGVGLASAGGPVGEHCTSEASQGAAYQRGTHGLVHLLLNQLKSKLILYLEILHLHPRL